MIAFFMPSISMPVNKPAAMEFVRSAILSGAISVSTVLASDSKSDITIAAYHGLR